MFWKISLFLESYHIPISALGSHWCFNWLSFTPLEPIIVLHFEDSTVKVTSQWLPKLYFTVLMPHEMKLCILSLFFLVHVPWFTLAMKSFSVSWTENDFESKMGSELAGESSKNVWIHELPFLGQRSPGTAQFWLFCIHRPASSQPRVCCSSLHYWSSPAPVKLGCGDWKCCEVALICFSHWFLPFARSFNLGQKSVVRTSKVASLQFYKSKGYLPFGRILQSSVNRVRSLYQIFFSFWKSRHILLYMSVS